MNPRLEASASPYLRAHAGNPVAWYPWGDDAFAEARRRDVPVLVSIGYSTCHWCHVMARESFADPETAALMNRDFVAIKVDREEHPEVDAAYMAAAAAFTAHLGWPLTVFTTPEGRPFYAGTYFPPEPRSGLPSFTQVLGAVTEAWTERREQVDGTADAVAAALAETRAAASGEGDLPSVDDIAARRRRDRSSRRPRVRRLRRRRPGRAEVPDRDRAAVSAGAGAVRTANPAASAVADRALAAMAGSALRDPVEGGFFRYATRRDWTVPHYERMLTDNAQLLEVAIDAGDEPTARGIARFLIDVLQQPSGGFGAAQDSESWIDGARSEGGYYARDAASRADLDPPAVDGKVVTGWNGLAIGALARAGARLDEPAWIEAARWAAEAVLGANVRPDGRLVRASLDEIASTASATSRRLRSARLRSRRAGRRDRRGRLRGASARSRARLHRRATGAPRVPGGGDPVLAAQGIATPDAASDGDEPSGLSALADAAVSLWRLGGRGELRAVAERIVAAHAAGALEQPLAYGALLRVAAELAQPPHQLVVVAEERSGPLVAAARRAAVRRVRGRDSRAGGGVVARGLRAVRRARARRAAGRPPTTAATSPAACRSPTLPS